MRVLIYLLLNLISLSESQVCDINLDGKGDLTFIRNGIAIVEIDGEQIFESNKDYLIKEIFCEDIDGDKKPEIALSLWKHGNYGNAKPFWVKENDNSYQMHLFLYKFDKEKLKPFWHSSSLARQNLKLIPIGRGFIAIEKSYENYIFSLSLAIWKTWGFEVKTISGI